MAVQQYRQDHLAAAAEGSIQATIGCKAQQTEIAPVAAPPRHHYFAVGLYTDGFAGAPVVGERHAKLASVAKKTIEPRQVLRRKSRLEKEERNEKKAVFRLEVYHK